MTVFRSRLAAAICLLTATAASISLAGLARAQSPAPNWPFDEQNQPPAAQPKSAVQQRLEELYRRDGRPLPDYMQQDGSSNQAGPATPSQSSAEPPAQRNQRGGAASQGTVHDQLSDYYQSEGKAIPAPRRAPFSSAANSTQNSRNQPNQASTTQPAQGHWYDRMNPFHKSTPVAQPHSQAQSAAAASIAANASHPAAAQQEATPANPLAVEGAAQPSPAAVGPAAKPSSFWGDLTLRRVPQQPAPIWIELGPSGRLVKKDKAPAPTESVVATPQPEPAPVAVAPTVVAPDVVAPAIVAVPVDPQPGPPVTQKVAAANVATEAEDPTMPFRASSEAEADQNESGPYTGLTLEEEQNQLVPPKVETPKVVHVAPQPVDAPKQTQSRLGDEAGHVSYSGSDEPEHVSVPQNAGSGNVSVPRSEEAGKVSLPQSAESEPTGPILPQPQPQSQPPAAEAAKPYAHRPQTTAEKQRLISERVGLRGFKGFCPVVLRDQRELADANPGYCSVYQGQRYCFSSSAAQARFDATPHKYTPAACGLDVVVKANSDQSVEGSLDFALWYKDRLYLFCSPESLQAFSMNPTAYAAAAQRIQ
jgi:YHS domain-containing protein